MMTMAEDFLERGLVLGVEEGIMEVEVGVEVRVGEAKGGGIDRIILGPYVGYLRLMIRTVDIECMTSLDQESTPIVMLLLWNVVLLTPTTTISTTSKLKALDAKKAMVCGLACSTVQQRNQTLE